MSTRCRTGGATSPGSCSSIPAARARQRTGPRSFVVSVIPEEGKDTAATLQWMQDEHRAAVRSVQSGHGIRRPVPGPGGAHRGAVGAHPVCTGGGHPRPRPGAAGAYRCGAQRMRSWLRTETPSGARLVRVVRTLIVLPVGTRCAVGDRLPHTCRYSFSAYLDGRTPALLHAENLSWRE